MIVREAPGAAISYFEDQVNWAQVCKKELKITDAIAIFSTAYAPELKMRQGLS
jgi:hypothetical protein